jgi:hypothetical protein
MSSPLPPSVPLSREQAAYGLLGGDHELRGRRLFNTGLGLLAAALVYLAYKANVDDILHLYQGLIIFALAFVPGLLWAKSGGSRFPIFEPIMLLCANAYAIPLLNGHEQLITYSSEVITQAGWAVIVYQLVAITIYQTTRGQPGSSRFWTEQILEQKVEKFIVYGLFLSTGYIAISNFTDWIPRELESILRAVFFGVGILCTFITTQRWGRGELTQSEKTVVIFTLGPQLIIQTVSLYLIATVSLLGIALLGFLSGGKRVPWVFMLSAFAVLAVMHNGKSKMRAKYWEGKMPAPTIAELPAYYSEWFTYGLAAPDENNTGERDVSTGRKLLERTSLMHILCLVVDNSPSRQPFLYGETYGYVLPQLIPRFFWPGKPKANVGTHRLGVYYGLQDEESTATTTIAFGMLAEAYANFGLLGGALLGIFWGVVLKKLQLLSMHSPMFSLAGLMMILITAWSFSSESTMAVWVSSLYQALIVVLGLPMLLRSLFGS